MNKCTCVLTTQVHLAIILVLVSQKKIKVLNGHLVKSHWAGYHLQEGLAKFGYRSIAKREFHIALLCSGNKLEANL
jgi:hypothetical protein